MAWLEKLHHPEDYVKAFAKWGILGLLVGAIGGLLGGWVVSLFGWYPIGTFSSLVASTIGAIVLLCILSLFTNARRYRDD